MTPFDAGFLFFVLPAAAALFVLAPKSLRLWAVALLGALMLWLAEPRYAPLLLLSVLFDLLACRAAARWGLKSAALLLVIPALFKDAAALALCGVWLPLTEGIAAPFGLAVLHLSLLFVLVGVCRGNRAALAPDVFLSYQLFPGRLSVGPFVLQGRCERLLKAQAPAPVVLLEGVCGVIVGAAKYVLLVRPLQGAAAALSQLMVSHASVAAAWAAALVPMMALWLTFSALSDAAWGLARVFGVSFPSVMRYPFGAESVAEHIWRLNLPLSETLGRTCFLGFRRRDGMPRTVVITALMPFLLALLLGVTDGLLLWAAWGSALLLLESALLPALRRLPRRLRAVLTLLCLLPAYAFASGSAEGFRVLPLLIGSGGAALIEERLLYLCRSNALLLLVSLAVCTGLPAALSRWVRRRRPTLWRLSAALLGLPLLVLTASFLIRK